MAIGMIEDSSVQATSFIECASALPFAMIVGEKKKNFQEIVAGCNGITVNDFFDELNLSEEAVYRQSWDIKAFVSSSAMPVDYTLCHFKKWRELSYCCTMFEKVGFSFMRFLMTASLPSICCDLSLIAK